MPNIHLVDKKITWCEKENPDFMLLYDIFTRTLQPDMAFKVFRAYYYSSTLDYIDISFIYVDGILNGFLSAAFYRTVMDGKPVAIGRAAIGVLPGRRGHLPVMALYAKYARYKISHPFLKLILTSYVANPLVYAMICRYTGIYYPERGAAAGAAVIDLKNALLKQSGLKEKEDSPFVVKIHFQVALGKGLLERIVNSENIYVKYYLAINPWFMDQYGVLVIIPVTFENVFQSMLKLVKNRAMKAYAKKFDWLTGKPKPGTGRVDA